jgi:uncharacterized protein
MWKPRWLLALPLALAASLLPGTARASAVRDQAGMFSPDAVRKAQAELDRVERENRLPTTVETVTSLEGEKIGDVLERRAEQAGAHGLFILISKDERSIDVRAARQYSQAITPGKARAIRQAFIDEFKKHDFDAGLLRGVEAIRVEAPAVRSQIGGAGLPVRRVVGRNRPGGFGLGSLLGIGLLVLGVLFIVRLLGTLFGGARGYAGPPGGMGRPGYGPGYGYGGGGGGFMSSLFGGIGGALAGNWLYDQMSGRHHGGYVDNSSYNTGDTGAPADAGPDDWSGGSDATGSWGGDAGGGDWGGGGGDWGGGGDGGAGGDW